MFYPDYRVPHNACGRGKLTRISIFASVIWHFLRVAAPLHVWNLSPSARYQKLLFFIAWSAKQVFHQSRRTIIVWLNQGKILFSPRKTVFFRKLVNPLASSTQFQELRMVYLVEKIYFIKFYQVNYIYMWLGVVFEISMMSWVVFIQVWLKVGISSHESMVVSYFSVPVIYVSVLFLDSVCGLNSYLIIIFWLI